MAHKGQLLINKISILLDFSYKTLKVMNNTDTAQKQINKNNYQKHINRIESRSEQRLTQVHKNNITTKDLGLVAVMLLQKQDITEIFGKPGKWILKKTDTAVALYEKYKDGGLKVEPRKYAATLINLLTDEKEDER